ncbi:phosphodiester glycosidase family protein [Sphingobacterium alkalisoli]|nr:phosphodiester glycosidase family protein [Sphingobacterium alkalisoli]
MIRKLYTIAITSLLIGSQYACQKAEEVGLYSIYQLDKYKQDKPVIELDPTVWEKQSNLMTTFPKGIEVYKRTAAINAKGASLFLLAFNPKLNIELKPVLSSSAKTPTAFYNDESGDVYACINGGYFFGTSSLSLVQYNGVVNATNVASLNRSYNGVSTPYYPTRAAFGLSSSYVPSVAWVYNVTAGAGGLYAYSIPSPNAEGAPPQARPSNAFPAGGVLWDKQTSIGGSPMLVMDSVINITDVAEMVTASATPSSARPRSAIGYLKNGNVVIVAAQGGSTEIPGLTMQELAEEMLAVGCMGAVNLDGGGSTSLVVDGQKTVVPSDAAGERNVVSALIVKKR